MIFIFGFQPRRSTIGPTEEKQCPHCSNTRFWLLGKHSDFISFFFIPLIPVRSFFFEYCPVCNFSLKLTQSEFRQKEAMARLNKEALKGTMTSDEYDENLKNMKS